VSTPAAPPSPLSLGSLFELTLSLALIIVLIVAAGWALRRLKMTGPRARGDIAVLDELMLGPRERIVLVRVGDAQVLIGVGAGGIVGLTPLAVPLSVKAPSAAPPFAERLRELMKRPGAAP